MCFENRTCQERKLNGRCNDNTDCETERRCIVEQLKTRVSQDRVGEHDVVNVRYHYDFEPEQMTDPAFNKSIKRVEILQTETLNFFGTGKQYTPLELRAHIRNLKTILRTLEQSNV